MSAPATAPKRYYRQRWFTILLSVMGFGLLLLVALPHAMSYGMHTWLLQNAGDDVRIANVDFNPFNGRAVIEGLQVDAEGETVLLVPRLELDIEWMPLFSKKVRIHAVGIDGVNVSVVSSADGALTVGGVTIPAASGEDVDETAEAVWGYGVDRLQVTNSRVRYRQPDLELDVHMETVGLDAMHSWLSESAPFQFSGSINGAATEMEGELPPLSSGTGYRGSISLAGLDTGDFAALLQGSLAELQGSLGVRLDVDALVAAETGDITVVINGGLDVQQLAVTLPGEVLALNQESLNWQGKANVSLPAGSAFAINLDSELKGHGLSVHFPEEALSVTDEAFDWAGTVSLRGGEELAVTADGKLTLARLGADTSTGEETIRFVQLGGVDLQSIHYEPTGEIALRDLTVNDVVFARGRAGHRRQEGGGSVLSASRVHVDTVDIEEDTVAIGTLTWQDIVSVVVRDEDGEWRPVRILDTLPFTGDEDTARSGEDVKGTTRVERIVITGNSHVLLEDNSVDPPFNLRMNMGAGSLARLDTGKPQQRSPVSVRSNFGKHSRFDVDGWIKPFADNPDMDIKIAAEGVAMLPLSPYMEQMFGYRVRSGQLDATSGVAIVGSQLESENQLTLRSLEVEATENESREQLDMAMAIPLDTALNMLRDSNDTINLDLPVSGNIDDPEFDASSVISLALGKAVKTGSLTFLALGLQPYGALISVAKIVGEEATKVRLQPVAFDAGSADSMLDSADYLEKVAGILKDRPSVNIKVCGLSVEEDRILLAGGAGKSKKDEAEKAGAPAEEEQLLLLAEQRASHVKDYLVEKHGVTAARLVACQPHIEDADTDGAPRVDLLI